MKLTVFQKILLIVSLFICGFVFFHIKMMRDRYHNLYVKTQEGFTTMISNAKVPFQVFNKYAIKASANSCYDATGFIEIGSEENPKGLYSVIKSGCRFLDFEIYNVDGETTVGYSGSSSFSSLETNTVKTVDVLNKIIDCAFTIPAPNPMDPLFLQFRMKTNKGSLYGNLAKEIDSVFNGKLLDLSGTSTFDSKTMPELLGKIVVIIYAMPPSASAKSELDVDISGVFHTEMGGRSFLFVNGKDNINFKDPYHISPNVKVQMPLINDLINERGNRPKLAVNSDAIEISFDKIQPDINIIPYKFYAKDEHLIAYEEYFKNSAFMIK